MGGIVSCGEAATTTLCTLWNPFSQPFDKDCSCQAAFFTAEPFALCPSYCIMDLEYKFGGQLWTRYGMS